VPIWEKLKSASVARDLADKAQCVAASFVRSLETADDNVNQELRRLAGQLERIAGRLENPARDKAA
jgi:hypothetical protein